MVAYPITGTREQRLAAWLAFHQVETRRRKGVVYAIVPRRHKRPAKLFLRDDGRTAAFVADRESNRSRRLERLMQMWNRGELYLPGATHDVAPHVVTVSDKADHDVQSMVDYHAAHPIGLDSIGAVTHHVYYDEKKRRTVDLRRVPVFDLVDLVCQLSTRQAYVLELAARERAFRAPAPAPLPLGQLAFDFAA